MGSLKRAELRRKQKEDESNQKTLIFKTRQEMINYAVDIAEHLAKLTFYDVGRAAIETHYQTTDIAMKLAYRDVTPKLGDKRMDRFVQAYNKRLAEIEKVFKYDNEKTIAEWCEFNNVDYKYLFGIKKDYSEKRPVVDENGDFILWIDDFDDLGDEKEAEMEKMKKKIGAWK